MHYNQSWAAKGQSHGDRHKAFQIRSMQRAAVSIYKTGDSHEILVFAPGRIKEHFHLEVKGNELHISYTPPKDFPRPEWVLREYSRGGFLRTFRLAETDDVKNITAKYTDGVLQVSVPMLKEALKPKQEIIVN